MIVDLTPAGVVKVNREGRITLANSLIETMFGYARSELLGQPIEMLVPERYRASHTSLRQRFLGNSKTRPMGEGRDLYGLRKDGTEFPVEIGLNPIMTPTGLSVLGVITDISARKQAEAALQAKTEELIRSNSDLQQFGYVASHDLQEPLRAIAGCVSLLKRLYGGTLDARADELIQHAVDGADRMRRLIDDLLAYSRTGRGERPADCVDCDIALTNALSNLEVAIEESGAEITRDPLPRVKGHDAELTLVLQNLIGNAIKFRRGDRPVRVHVGAVSRGETWLISIRDNGIGIEGQHLEHIFAIFKRLHTAKEYPGTGIGLSICKRVIENHGGAIWAESHPGQGTTMFFTLRPWSDTQPA